MKTTRTRKQGAMRTRYAVIAAVIICAIVIGVLSSMGPKLGLQTTPIESQAITYINKHNLLHKGETIEAFKAISYYTYKQGVVVTNKRVFIYNGDKVHSIPLNEISMVVLKNSELGHQEVMIAAQKNGVIGLELYHTYVPKLMTLLKVPNSKIKDVTNGMATTNAKARTSK